MSMEPAAVGRTAEKAVPWPQSIREFEALVDALGSRLVQFAFCRLHSAADAEDVVQDVLVQAYRDRERHKGVDNAIPFLFRMVANRSTDVLRRRKRAPGPLEETAAPPVPDVAEAVPSGGRVVNAGVTPRPWPELQAILPPLSTEERTRLEHSLGPKTVAHEDVARWTSW
jgi:DNA-directed RNA polymerase specialized sigma24 family protein